ncbi:MAG: thiamine diphosphokinase [Anaerolineales bacterium]|nr:thiamine diphosphokinase [Anaerolineales bacterium]
MHRILLFANGELPDLESARALLRPDDFILCADGGTRHALALGLTPNLIIGDMDSVEKETLKKFQNDGVELELFPRDKNETDLELALDKAIEMNPNEIIIVAALGGRMDQTLANIALLFNPQYAARNIVLDDGVEQILPCRDQVEVQGRSGDVVSLIPWGAPVHGIQTENLKWKLDHETLYPDKTRGISNEMTDDIAAVKIESGLLLVIHRRQSPISSLKSPIL